MYYIINQNNQVIAADDNLLSILEVKNIDVLTKQLILGEITLNLFEESVSIVTPTETLSYAIETSSLSSILGNFKLIHLLIPTEDTKENTDNNLYPLSEEVQENTADKNLSIEEPLIDNKEIDDLIFIKDSVPTTSIEETLPTDTNSEISLIDNSTPEMEDDENDLFDLTISNTPEETIEKISLESTTDEDTLKIENIEIENRLDTTPIIINVDAISKNIGISTADYNTFLDEYIDTAISLEEDLKSSDQAILSSAKDTLMQLADVLELPSVNEIITKLNNNESANNKHLVETFYATLSRLTTQNDTPTMSTFSKDELLSIEEPETEVPDTETKGFGTISLDDIKPIRFDFRLEEAATDLSLPVELIEEFVHDFIAQAHEETEKMLVAYENGDLETIQQIGHMLKGASSNLRINALSDTLYEIQFCEDSTKMADFIKRYWAHFLSFEQQIDILSK